MNIVLIGNAIALVGALLMAAIGLLRKKEQILIAQCFQFGIMGVANLVLGGVTGFVSNIISIVRNLICYRREFTMPLKLVFIAVQVIFSAAVNRMGLVGWLPIFSVCVFTWFLDTKSEVSLKVLILFTQIPWLIYDILIRNYVSAAFDVLAIVSNTVGMILLLRAKARGKNTPGEKGDSV